MALSPLYERHYSQLIYLGNKLLKINSTKAKLQNDLQSSYYEDNLKV